MGKSPSRAAGLAGGRPSTDNGVKLVSGAQSGATQFQSRAVTGGSCMWQHQTGGHSQLHAETPWLFDQSDLASKNQEDTITFEFQTVDQLLGMCVSFSSVCPTLWDPDCATSDSSTVMISPGKNAEWYAFLLRGSSDGQLILHIAGRPCI